MNAKKTRREAGQQQKKLATNYRPRPDRVQALNRRALIQAFRRIDARIAFGGCV